MPRRVLVDSFPDHWRTIARSYDAWWASRGKSPQSQELRMYHLRRLARWAGDRGPFDLGPRDLMEFWASIGGAPSTRHALRVSLRVFYAWALDVEYIAVNPALKIPEVKVGGGRPRPLPDDVYLAALAAAPTPGLRLAIRLAGTLGLRRAEVASIHASDLLGTDSGHVITVHGKGGKERALPVPADIAAQIAELTARNHGGWLLPGVGDDHMTPHWLGTQVSRLLGGDWTMHKLRHRALTRAYNDSKDLLMTATIAGHGSVAITQKYYVAPDYAGMRKVIEGMAAQ